MMSSTLAPRRPIYYGAWFIVASLFGLAAAFELTLARLESLAGATGAACDFSVIVQCSANIGSWQGSVFGFPNPLIGLVAWPFILVTGVLLVLNVKLPKIYLGGILGGLTLGVGFIGWLIYQSIFIIGTLCPWCMVTWAALVPTFLSAIAYTLDRELFGERLKPVASRLHAYVPLFSIVIFAAIAAMAQLRLDWIATL